MNNKNTFQFEINNIYFRLIRLLRGLKLWKAILLSLMGGAFIFTIGLLCANLSINENFLIIGLRETREWITSYSYKKSESFNILASLYVTATIFFFFINLFLLPFLIKIGLKIINRISRIYTYKNRTSFHRDVRHELKCLRHYPYFIVAIGVIFLLGEIVVIQYQSLAEGKRWTAFFIGYLLVIPVSLNAILVGTQSSLIYSIIRIIKKLMPPLPAKLYDDDGYAGLVPAGTFICILSLIWLVAMFLLTPLFILSRDAGVGMFLSLGLIGFTLFSIPLYQFHKKLLNRKRRIMAMYAKALNKSLFMNKIRPTAALVEQIKMLQDCYKRAQSLKVWVLFSTPSMGLQIISVIWALVNKDVIKIFRELTKLSSN